MPPDSATPQCCNLELSLMCVTDLFGFSAEPFFIDFVVRAVLLCFQRVAYGFELTIAGHFNEVKDIGCIMQHRGWYQAPYKRCQYWETETAPWF